MEIIPIISKNGDPIHVDYAIYPSLLDAYLRYKRNDDDETFDSLFDKINGQKYDQTESQLKGVELEKMVNDVIDGVYPLPVGECHHWMSKNFTFKSEVIKQLHNKLYQATGKQVYMDAVFRTHVGNIKLYGIVDYDFPGMVADLKGTDNYKCNKYQDSSQHQVYSLIRELNGRPIKAFKYLVTDYDKVFQETYIPTDGMYDKLMVIIFEFITFINHFKANITDEKIFGKETRPQHLATSIPEVR